MTSLKVELKTRDKTVEAKQDDINDKGSEKNDKGDGEDGRREEWEAVESIVFLGF